MQDWFYVCPAHLKDTGFCTPKIDHAAIEARRKRELDEEVERVKKEYEEKQKKRKEKEAKSDKKDEAEDKKDKDDKSDKDRAKTQDKTEQVSTSNARRSLDLSAADSYCRRPRTMLLCRQRRKKRNPACLSSRGANNPRYSSPPCADHSAPAAPSTSNG